MKLEAAIKQKEFPDIHLRAFLEILYTASEIRNMQTRFFKKFGLSPEQYNILRILRGSHPNKISMHEIKIRMVNKTPHTTRMVDKLEKRALVERTRECGDRRKICIHIRPSGLELMAKIDGELPELIGLMHNLTAEEALALSQLLEKTRG